MNTVPFEDNLKFLGSKLVTIVSNDRSGFSVSPDDIFQQFDRNNSRTLFESPSNGCGGYIIDRGDDVSVASDGLDQFSDEVDFPEFESVLDVVGVNGCIVRRLCRPLVQLAGYTRIQHLPSFFLQVRTNYIPLPYSFQRCPLMLRMEILH